MRGNPGKTTLLNLFSNCEWARHDEAHFLADARSPVRRKPTPGSPRSLSVLAAVTVYAPRGGEKEQNATDDVNTRAYVGHYW